ncbi:MAG: single-stranded DNA-binding protein [Clostridia bacterium]|nr:single-stranded DNA-binding protein [Clostridia bacterium]
MNKFQFMGRLTKDPETRVIPNSNTQVTTFSVAVNRRFADQNGERKTDFFNLTAFGKLAEFCSKYYRKGQQVLVEGRIQNRSWDDQNGQKRYATDFIIENAYFADSRRDSDSSMSMDTGAVPSSSIDGEFITIDDTDDLPF